LSAALAEKRVHLPPRPAKKDFNVTPQLFDGSWMVGSINLRAHQVYRGDHKSGENENS